MIKAIIEEIKFDFMEWMDFRLMKIEKTLEAQYLKCINLMFSDKSGKVKVLTHWQKQKRHKQFVHFLQKNKHLALTYCNLGVEPSSLLELLLSQKNEANYPAILAILDIIELESTEKKNEFWFQQKEFSYALAGFYFSNDIIFEKMVKNGAKFTDNEFNLLTQTQHPINTSTLSKRLQFYQQQLIENEKNHLENVLNSSNDNLIVKKKRKI